MTDAAGLKKLREPFPASQMWRPVVGYEGFYEVSDEGRVRSVPRTIYATGSDIPRRYTGRLLKQIERNGYPYVGLSMNNRVSIRSVHRLVLTAFVGPQPPRMQGCHNDGNRANCRLSNLRWDTPANNSRDAVKHGTHRQVGKTECPQHHPYDEANTYITKTGSRQCNQCRAAHRAKRYAA